MATRNHAEDAPLRLLERRMAMEYDADEACRIAIDHLADPRYQDQLTAFRADYQRHLRELEPIVRRLGGKPPSRLDIRGRLEEGKVLLAQLGSDDAILKTIRTNTQQLVDAYEHALGQGPAEAQEAVVHGRDDQRRQVDWLTTTIKALETAPHRGVPPWNIPPPSGF